MNKQFLVPVILVVLTLVGFSLRLLNGGNIPAILNRDEAALAYNGYLLAEVGQDEWGRRWPLALESFGDYKLPGYPVLLSLLFQVLPLEDWVVRLPSVVAGSALIPLGYWFARRLNFSPLLSVLVAGLVTLTPVFFFYSRVAFEANVALTLLIAALVLMLAAKPRPFLDIAALVLLLLAVFTYNTPLLLIPFLWPLLMWHRGFTKWRSWNVPVVGLVLIFGGVMSLLWSLTSQKSGITIFSDESTWRAWIAYRESLVPALQPVVGSRYFFWVGLMLKNWLHSFSPQFLVTQGGTHPWHSLPGWGHLLWSTYGLAVIGLVTTLAAQLRLLLSRKARLLHSFQAELGLLYLTVVSLAPSIITVDAPHTTRSLFFFFLMLIWAIQGFKVLTQRFNYRVLGLLLGVVVFFESTYYLSLYFSRFPAEQDAWQPGFETIIQQVEREHPDDEVAIVDGGGFQYILTAWYLKLPAPTYFQNNIRQLPDKIGFRYGERVTHYHFIAQPQDRKAEKVLVRWDEDKWVIEP